MPEITMLGAVGVWTIGAAVGGAIGNLSDRRFCALQRRLVESNLPRNHDLALAVRRSQMLALRLSVKGYAQLKHPSPLTYPGYSPDDIERPLVQHIHTALADKKGEDLDVLTRFDAILGEIEAAFVSPAPTDHAPAKRLAAFRRLCEDWVLAEAAAIVGVERKDWPNFEDIVRKGTPKKNGSPKTPAWWDGFRAFLGEMVKVEPRLAAILNQQAMSAILDHQVDMAATLEKLQHGQRQMLQRLGPALAVFAQGVARFEAALAQFENALDVLYAMREDVRVIRETTARSDVKQDQHHAEILAKLEELASDRSAYEAARTKIEELQARSQMTERVILGVLTSFGESNLPPERLLEQLSALPARYGDLVQQLSGATDMPAEFEADRKRARIAIDMGDLDGADYILADLDLKHGRWLDERQSTVDQGKRDRAQTRLERAALALFRLDYNAAAALFAAAADTYPPNDHEERWQAHLRQADALADRGDIFLDPTALLAAVSVYRDYALPLALHEAAPAQWARTQHNLGTALASLGKRGDDGALREAIAAYRLALEIRTREAAPAQWARTQNNLGNALCVLGDRGDDAALREAIAAFGLALEVCTRESAPADWAATQHNLGNALASLGERGDDGALREAIATYRLALEVRTRAAAPAHWAMTQNNLGGALRILGDRSGNKDDWRAAAARYRAALEVWTPETHPSYHDNALRSLASVLEKLGDA